MKERTDTTSTRSLDKSGEKEKEGDKDTVLSNKDENVLTTQNGKTEVVRRNSIHIQNVYCTPSK